MEITIDMLLNTLAYMGVGGIIAFLGLWFGIWIPTKKEAEHDRNNR